MFRNNRKIAIFVFWAFSASFAGRPMITADAGTVSARDLEFEIAADYNADVLATSWALIHGLTERLDWSLSSAYVWFPQGERHWLDLSFSLKYALLAERMALKFDGLTGSRNWSVLVVLSHEWMGVELHGNAGAEISSGTRHASPIYNAMVSVPVKSLRIGAEYLGKRDGADFWGMGIQWGVTRNFALDTGIHMDMDKNWLLSSGVWTAF